MRSALRPRRPAWAAASLLDALELLAELAGRPLDVRNEARESGDVTHTGADIARARAALGFDPSTPLADGLRAELEWVRARAGSASARLLAARDAVPSLSGA
jgi:nucleoside-diphosphate-sugar epimerase